MPLHGTAALCEDFVKERHAGEDAGAFAEERRRAGVVADYEAAVVEARGVFFEPVCDLGFEVDGEEVGGVAILCCHLHGDCCEIG